MNLASKYFFNEPLLHVNQKAGPVICFPDVHLSYTVFGKTFELPFKCVLYVFFIIQDIAWTIDKNELLYSYGFMINYIFL